eukprot:gene4588-9117_t
MLDKNMKLDKGKPTSHKLANKQNSKVINSVIVNGKDKMKFKKISQGNSPNSKISNTKSNGKNIKENTSKSVKGIISVKKWWQKTVDLPLVSSKAGGGHWYDDLPSYASEEGIIHRIDKDSLTSLTQTVTSTFEKEVATYNSKQSAESKSERKWIEEVIHSGTLSDRIAALALQIQESPIHHLTALDDLITLANKKEQRSSQLALEALKDLLIHNLLPDRRLNSFLSNSLGNPKMNMKHALLLWYESELLSRMDKIIIPLDLGLKSTVDYYKRICMELIADWLINKPEQESRLLSLLVNKLGDPKGQISSKCMELLKNVIKVHPAMKSVIVQEVRQLIFRTGIPPRAVYNGIVFLSQIPLDNKNITDATVAIHLVEAYISLFELAIKQEESGSKLLSMLLNGINRAFPHLTDKASIATHLDAIFRIVHSATFTTATRALILISHIAFPSTTSSNKVMSDNNKKADLQSKNKDTINNNKGSKDVAKEDKSKVDIEMDLLNRYYRALYSKLLSDEICTRTHNSIFLNLLYRSIKRDPSDIRAMSFLKRLAIVSTHSAAHIAAALLLLISEVFRTRESFMAIVSVTDDEVPLMDSTTTQSVATDDKDRDDDENNSNNMHIFGSYDGSKREPLFAAKSTPALWELSLLRNHFHPSVKAFARCLVTDETNHLISFQGDPTEDFNLSSFLNRFAYKNPKKQQIEKATNKSQIKNNNNKLNTEIPVNSIEFQLKNANEIAPDKAFFYKYFGSHSKLLEEGKVKNRRRRKSGGDDDDEDDEDQIDRFADKLDGDGELDSMDEDDDVGRGGKGAAEAYGDMDSDREVMEFDEDGEEEEYDNSNKSHKRKGQPVDKTVKTKKSKKESGGDDFADFAQYEDEVNTLLQEHFVKRNLVSNSSSYNTSNNSNDDDDDGDEEFSEKIPSKKGKKTAKQSEKKNFNGGNNKNKFRRK